MKDSASEGQPGEASIPRLVVSAPHRSSGKSTVATGLCAALGKRGVEVQPFKKGPDFIDPMWLSAAAGRQCRNLDFYMMGAPGITRTFTGHAGDGLCLVECNHGLHDGLDLEGGDSSAALARLLDAPVLLVVNAARLTRGVAPLLLGQIQFDRQVRIAGVVINRVSSRRHEEKIRAALGRYCDVPVLGAMPYLPDMEIAERHLGLTPLREDPSLVDCLEKMGRAAETYLDVDALIEIAGAAPPIPGKGLARPAPPPSDPVRVGVAVDRAFNFYYPENLEALEAAGAELVPFSPLEDGELPSVEGLYLGGGFPEFFMEELEGNSGLREKIRLAVAGGLPVWAECGGLIYLARRVRWRGREASMVGALPCDIEMSKRPAGHGYVELEERGKGPWPQSGRRLRGHEFHHSRVVDLDPGVPFAYRVLRGGGTEGGQDGMIVNNCLATYTHLHHGGAPFWAKDVVAFIGGENRARP